MVARRRLFVSVHGARRKVAAYSERQCVFEARSGPQMGRIDPDEVRISFFEALGRQQDRPHFKEIDLLRMVGSFRAELPGLQPRCPGLDCPQES